MKFQDHKQQGKKKRKKKMFIVPLDICDVGKRDICTIKKNKIKIHTMNMRDDINFQAR